MFARARCGRGRVSEHVSWLGRVYRMREDDISQQNLSLRSDGLDIHFEVAVGPVVMLLFSTALMQPIVTIVIFPGDAGAVN